MDRHSIQERMVRAGILPSDVVESFARSSGPGGQHVNKVSTAVTLLHRPSGTRVTVQDSRSQAINRRLARERLIAAIEERQRANRIARRADRERERRRKSPRPRKLKHQILESKRKRSELKRERRRISE
jgi:protein subunit release factor B